MDKKVLNIICVDYQTDFLNLEKSGCNPIDAHKFIQEKLVPFLKKNGLKCSEIKSDYRLPRGKSNNYFCSPEDDGFKSLFPTDLIKFNPLIKCMHNPIWTRKNIGKVDKKLGKCVQKPRVFDRWIKRNLDLSSKDVYLFGFSLDCCILNVAQELYFRGFDVYVIYECTETMFERASFKSDIAYNSSIAIYAKCILFSEFAKKVECD